MIVKKIEMFVCLFVMSIDTCLEITSINMSDKPSTPAHHRVNVPRTPPNVRETRPKTGARTATDGQKNMLKGIVKQLF
jgi:hypothetical protein